MRVMVIVKATESSEAGRMPSEQLMAEMGRFNEELASAGVMQAGEGLQPSSRGVRVHFRGKDRSVTDGPFAETKELIAGFWLWEVQSLEEAVDWVKRCPNPMLEDSDIEIRPLFETEDFAECDPSGKLRADEEALRGRLAAGGGLVHPYLFFGGRCEEALEFYTQSIGAKVGCMMRFSECPDPDAATSVQAGFEHKIMHADFKVGSMRVMASDGCDDQSQFSGFRLALLVPTESDAERVFAALSAGGAVEMPLAKTFWSPRYGMLTDQFGVGWMVMVSDDAK